MKETKCERGKPEREKRKKAHQLIINQAQEIFTIHVEKLQLMYKNY